MKATSVSYDGGGTTCRPHRKTTNQSTDSHIATPISAEGLSGCEGSGSVGVLDEASVSSGLFSAATHSSNLQPIYMLTSALNNRAL